MPVPDTFTFNGTMNYVFDFFDELKIKAFMFHSNQLSGGAIKWPEGKPLLYANSKVAMPDLASIGDGLLSIGTIIDPIGTLVKTFTQDLPGSIGKSEANVCAGIAPPKPIGDGFGFSDIICGCVGLYPGTTVKACVNLLDSEDDKKALWYKTQVKIPVIPDINWQITNEAYVLKCGIVNKIQLPVINGSIKVDLLDETFAMTTSGPLSPKWQLIVARKRSI